MAARRPRTIPVSLSDRCGGGRGKCELIARFERDTEAMMAVLKEIGLKPE